MINGSRVVSEKERLLQALTERGGILSEAMLATYAGVRAMLVSSFMRELMRDGKCKRSDDGKFWVLIGEHRVTKVDAQPFSTPKPSDEQRETPAKAAPSAPRETQRAPSVETKLCRRCEPKVPKPVTQFRKKVNGERADICNECWNKSVSEGIKSHGLHRATAPPAPPRPPVPTAADVAPRETVMHGLGGPQHVEVVPAPARKPVTQTLEVEERPGLKCFIDEGFAIIKQGEHKTRIHPAHIGDVLEWLTNAKAVLG